MKSANREPDLFGVAEVHVGSLELKSPAMIVGWCEERSLVRRDISSLFLGEL